MISNNNGNNKGAVDTLRKRLSSLREQVRALEIAIGVLEQGEELIAPVASEIEFVSATIPEAVESLIKRAKRPLHVNQIVKGLKDGGFRFRTGQPKKTVPGALHGAIKNKKTTIQFIGKNNFTIPEIGTKQ